MSYFKSIILFLLIFLHGCGTSPTVINGTFNVSDEVNPDISDRPSPIVVRVYELKSLGIFEAADFYSLFENPETILGADLVNSVQFHLNPGDTRVFKQTTAPETKYIAVTAAFRKLDHAGWRAHIKIPTAKTSDLLIKLEKLHVTIMKKEK